MFHIGTDTADIGSQMNNDIRFRIGQHSSNIRNLNQIILFSQRDKDIGNPSFFQALLNE